MKKTIIFIFCVLLFFATSKAQTSTLTGIDIIEPTTAFKTTSLYLLGVDKSETPNQLMYSFVHPNGGIQTETGRVMAGEKGAINLKAFGAISLGGNLDNPKHNLKWVRNKRSDNGYYLSDELGDQKIASNEEIISFKDFDGMVRKLSRSSAVFPMPKKTENKEIEKEPTYVENYKMTRVGMGLSGKISYLSLADYTLKPKEERNKGLLGLAYKMDASTNKDHTKTAFGNEALSYKTPLTGIPQLNDPVSGNAVVFSGLKYKKNKAKENSHFYEFMLLAFNHQGEVLNRRKIESKIPLEMEAAYPIYGENLAPGIDEITHGIFVAKGDGNKGSANRNLKFRKVFIVDMKTGKIIAEDEIEFAHGYTYPLRARKIGKDKMELSYFYPHKNHQGIVMITVGLKGIEHSKEIKGKSDNFEEVGLEERLYTNLNLETMAVLANGNAGTIKLEKFLTVKKNESTNVTTTRIHGHALMLYDNNDQLVDLHGIGNLTGKNGGQILKLNKDAMWIMIPHKKADGTSRIKFLKISLEDFSVAEAMTSENESFIYNGQYHYEETTGMVYLLGQKSPNQGVVLIQYTL